MAGGGISRLGSGLGLKGLCRLCEVLRSSGFIVYEGGFLLHVAVYHFAHRSFLTEPRDII
jgi:hypothetical protein